MSRMRLDGEPNGLCRHCGRKLAPGRKREFSTRRYCNLQCYWAGVRKAQDERRSDENRTCTKCGEEKAVNCFSPGSKTKGDGLHGWCKACRATCETERRKRRDLIERRKKRYAGDLNYRANAMLQSLKKRSRDKGVKLTLTKEWLAERFARSCELSGFAFDLTGADKFFAPTVDRIKAGGDYTPENCRMIIWGLNTALCDWGLDRYLMLAKVMVFINFPDVHEIPTAKLRSVA